MLLLLVETAPIGLVSDDWPARAQPVRPYLSLLCQPRSTLSIRLEALAKWWILPVFLSSSCQNVSISLTLHKIMHNCQSAQDSFIFMVNEFPLIVHSLSSQDPLSSASGDLILSSEQYQASQAASIVTSEPPTYVTPEHTGSTLLYLTGNFS